MFGGRAGARGPLRVAALPRYNLSIIKGARHSTTTIRLPEDPKARVAVVERAGTTSHNFILQAISEKTAQEELRCEFNDVAENRYAAIVAMGKTIPWREMRSYS